MYDCWKIICSATNITMQCYLLKDEFRNKEEVYEHKYTKNEAYQKLPKGMYFQK